MIDAGPEQTPDTAGNAETPGSDGSTDSAEAERAAERPQRAAATDRLEALLAEHREPAADEPEKVERSPLDPLTDILGTSPPEPTPGHGEAGEAAQAQEEVHDSSLPDAPLFALLRNIEQDVGVHRIDRIWVFPPRRLETGETSVVVVAAFPDIDTHRRRVYAAHYTAREEATEPWLALDEYGTAPTERVGRLVEEVVERIKDGPAGAPRSHHIDGRADRWTAIVHELAEAYLAEVQKNPRLRR